MSLTGENSKILPLKLHSFVHQVFIGLILCDGHGPELGSSYTVRRTQSPRLSSLLTPTANLGGSKFTLSFDNLLGGLIDSLKAVTLTVMDYYRERIQMIISQGKCKQGRVQEGSQSASVVLS